LFEPNFGLNMDKPSHWVTFLNYIFNPTAGFVYILPKIGFKQPSIFLECTVYVKKLHVITERMNLGCGHDPLQEV